MNTLVAFFENYPSFTAVVIAVLFSASISFDVVVFRSRALGGLSLLLGLLALLACFSGALKKGILDVGIVVLVTVAFVGFAHHMWKKRTHEGGKS